MNRFILNKILPAPLIENWSIVELCYLHEEQIRNKGDESFLKKIRDLIREKKNKLTEEQQLKIFVGDGMCSEYRNSERIQYERLKEILEI